MRKVGIAEAKNNLSALLDRVRRGEQVLITDRGHPVAILSRPQAAAGAPAAVQELERQGLLRRGSGDPDPILLMPPSDASAGAGVLEALLEERGEGR